MTEAASPPSGNEAAPPSGQQAEPVKAEPVAAAAPPAPRRHKVTDGDREIEVTDAEYVDRIIAVHGNEGIKRVEELTRGTRKLMAEAGVTRKQLAEAAADLKNPKAMLALMRRIHGPDVTRQEIEEFYHSDVTERAKDPKVRDLDDREAKLTERERRIAERDRAEQEKATQAAIPKMQAQFRTAFEQAVAPHGVKLTEVMSRRMSLLVENEVTALRNGGHEPSRDDWRQIIADAGREVASKHFAEIETDFPNMPAEKRAALVTSTLASMKPSEIAAAIGEQRMREFRRWDLEEARRRRGTPAPLAPQPKPKPTNGSSERKRVEVDDWLPERFPGGR